MSRTASSERTHGRIRVGRSRPVVFQIGVAVAALGWVCGCGSASEVRPAVGQSADADRVDAADAASGEGWRERSQAGFYRISIRPEQGAPRIGPLHAWLVQIESRAGTPVSPTGLVFDGGMPQHGHGFETSPRVTGSLGDGAFRVDGVRFHMPGAWKLRVDVAGPDGVDFAVFDVEVGP
jgi:YtkA-like